MKTIDALKVKIFADGADIKGILKLCENPYIKGFTTNPTLMRKSNVKDYRGFALEVINIVKGRSVSFEVFSDEFELMEKQALQIASWGAGVYVKIPITNTRGEDAGPLVRRLTKAGIKVNVTALTTPGQVEHIVNYLAEDTPSYVSVFAGRIADTGCDPVPIMAASMQFLRKRPSAELIWASPRELLNIFQAESVGCHIITVSNDLLAKLPVIGKDLTEYSMETVRMFYRDAVQAGFNIKI
ncbi:MAG: transaldolase [Verrucomicrobia bacterium]|nr:transaldolase [Verrucomicrobiota bacterium]